MRKLKIIIIGFASMFAGTPQEIMVTGEVIHICSPKPGDIWKISSYKFSKNFLLAFDADVPVFLAKCGEPDWSFATMNVNTGKFHQNKERHESEASALEFLNKAAEEKFGETKPLLEMKELLLEIQAKEITIKGAVPADQIKQFQQAIHESGFRVSQASLDELRAFVNTWKAD